MVPFQHLAFPRREVLAATERLRTFPGLDASMQLSKSTLARNWLGRSPDGPQRCLLVPNDYPNRLTARGDVSTPQRWRPWVLLGLLILTLAPRALMAWKLDVICCDGVLYIHLAEALERGDLATALSFQFNLFPSILWLLHKIGLPWEMAGELWNVMAATLVVLPLWGWARRQFDDRVALVACVLYAVHPKLIEWSAELIRGPTFWLLYTLSLYLAWRAVTEVRLGYYLAAGLTIALTALTRFEGLFLFIPLLFWTGVRWLSVVERRRRLLAGVVLSGVGLPLLLLLANLAWLSQPSSWELLRLEPLQRAKIWIASWSAEHTGKESTGHTSDALPPKRPSLAAASSTALPAAVNAASPLEQTWQFVHLMERGFTPVFGLLFLWGFFSWFRLFIRCDYLPLSIVALLICTGIWIHLWFAAAASSRYTLSIVIMSTCCAALGLLSFSAWLIRFVQRFTGPLALDHWRLAHGALPVAGLATALVIGWSDALSSGLEPRHEKASLGSWIRAQYGESRQIADSDEMSSIVGYYAKGNCYQIPTGLADESLLNSIHQRHPDLVVLWKHQARPCNYQALLDHQEQLGLRQIESSRLPAGGGNMLVLARVPTNR